MKPQHPEINSSAAATPLKKGQGLTCASAVARGLVLI
jgi:hypothetical protein